MKSLKQAREEKGLKLSAVADCLGVSRHTYRKYENNQDSMSIDQAKAACAFIGVSVSDIFLPQEVN